jgi:hypothetical protein
MQFRRMRFESRDSMMPADSYVGVMGRADSDEHYVLDLCDEVLGERSSRQHRFDWLVGDPSPNTGKARRLPVDAYWEPLKLVVEFREHQHYEAVEHFDKPDRLTVSGVHRGEQRRIYDQRREQLIPAHGLRLIIIKTSDFELRGKRLRRSPVSDREVVRQSLSDVIKPNTAALNTAEWADAPAAAPLDGTEAFIGTSGTVLDFWRFAMSDLRTNNLRGYLAEFLVAQAVEARSQRVEWDSFDVQTPEGVTIEVKASGYLQAWAQRRPSTIIFSGLLAKKWTPQAGYAQQSTYNADVYVFCVETATTHEEYNPLDVSQWDFYVMARDVLAATGQGSLGLSRVRALSGEAVTFQALGESIETARQTRTAPKTSEPDQFID